MTKIPKGTILHVFNKSIANYPIFKDLNNSFRFKQVLTYYNDISNTLNLGNFLKTHLDYSPDIFNQGKNNLSKFLAYCIMPDHYHLLVKILFDSCLSRYIGIIENSYTRFFNIKFKRKGPLWQSRFKYVIIKSNEQLLHVSRYIHLNPCTSNLAEKPEDWIYSSYKDYLNNIKLKKYFTEISINSSKTYKKFVENQIDYQKKLRSIKKVVFE